MSNLERYLSFLLLGLCALGMGFIMYLLIYAPRFTILSHGFRPPAAFLTVWFLAAYGGMVLFWMLLPRLEQGLLGAELRVLQRENLACLMPFTLGLAAPFMLRHYLNVSDFRIRLNLLLLITGGGIVLLKALQYGRHLRGRPRRRPLDRFARFSRRRRCLILFFTAFLIYNAGAAVLVTRGLSFSGDEPYYLLTAQSLYQDRDINVADEYDQGEHVRFYPKELYPQVKLGVYARVGRRGPEYRFPVNQPGVSALILPWYALSQVFHGRLLIFFIKSSLALWGALLGVQLYLLAMQMWDRQDVSLTVWFLFSFTVPIFFYAFHVYPAVPIALFSIFIYRKARSRGPLKAFPYVFCGLLLGTFPWFGLKYNMVFWPLLGVAVYFFLRDHKLGWRILWFLVPPLAAMGGFYLYVYHLFGTFNPIAVYEGVLNAEKLRDFREVMLHTPLMLRIDSFLDYFLDQRDGLLPYAPWYLFAIPGFIEMFRRARSTLISFVLLSGPFLFNYAFFAHRQGSSPQGRVLAPLAWMGAIGIGFFLVYNRKRLYSLLFTSAAAISVSIVLILLSRPHFLYQPTTHEFTFRGSELFISLSHLNFYLPDLLPSFLKIDNLGHVANHVWLGLILLFGLGYAAAKDWKPPRSLVFRTGAVLAVLGVLFLWLCLYPRIVLLFPDNVTYPTGEKVSYFGLGRSVRMTEPGRFAFRAADRSYELTFTSWRPIRKLRLGFGTDQGEYAVKVELFDVTVFSERMDQGWETLSYAEPPAYRYKSINLYQLKISMVHLAGEPTSGNPFRMDIFPQY